jgi:hypothetical protein
MEGVGLFLAVVFGGGSIGLFAMLLGFGNPNSDTAKKFAQEQEEARAYAESLRQTLTEGR